MAPRKTKSTVSKEEKLKKKREAERLRYARIKNDPTAYEEHLKKRAMKYQKQKEKGLVKMVSEMGDREHRAKKRQWRVNTKSYRERIKKKASENAFLRENSPPSSDNDVPVPGPSRQFVQGRKKTLRRLAVCLRANEKLREENERLRKEIDRSRKREFREKTKTPSGSRDSSVVDSPRTTVRKIIKEGTDSVRRRLLLNETFKTNVLDKYKSTKSIKTKKAFKKLLKGDGTFLRKYGLINKFRQLSDGVFRRGKRSHGINTTTTLHSRLICERVRLDVQHFFEQDDVSRMCPGKKDTVTRNKVKKQKRYLSDTLTNLHARFLKFYPCKISYASFCSLRPFWVVKPKVTDRDTCKCIHHENFSLIINALHNSKVVPRNTVTGVMEELCCNVMDVKCLHRQCKTCQERSVLYREFDGQRNIEYFQWVSKKETYLDKKTRKQKTVTKIKKDSFHATLYQLVQVFEQKLESFFIHEGNAKHQYAQMTTLKQHLKKDDVLICADFSENYCLKYGTEIQSFHFGGSRQQISLHTVVVYYRPDDYSPLKCKSICTASECLDHSAGAIWAHFNPVFDWIRSINPKIEKCHFFTDGPSTQYKNKTMFYLFAKGLKENFPHLRAATWNYHEAGHGKGAADGVGGCVKRMADSVVAAGKDISDFPTFLSHLDNTCRNILVKHVTEEEMSAVHRCIPQGIRPFKGTMKVHQAVYSYDQPSRLKFRSLSCFHNYSCNEFSLGVHQPMLGEQADEFHPMEHLALITEDHDDQEPDQDTVERAVPLGEPNDNEDVNEQVPSFDPPSPFNDTCGLETGEYVLVRFLAKKKFVFYVGQVVEKFSSTDYDVSFMRRSAAGYFTFPSVKDVSSIALSDVISILRVPKQKRDRYYFPVDLTNFTIR